MIGESAMGAAEKDTGESCMAATMQAGAARLLKKTDQNFCFGSAGDFTTDCSAPERKLSSLNINLQPRSR